MKRGIQKFHFLWGLSGIFGLLLVFWQDFDTQWNSQKPSFIHFLDRHWLSFKQSIEKNWIRDKRPSPMISLFEPYFENRASFWLDAKFRTDLRESLIDYPGQIIMNVDPQRLQADEILAGLLDKPNLIRSFYISEREPPNLKLESMVAKPIVQNPEALLNEHIGLIPREPTYYENDSLFGSLGFIQDEGSRAAQFILTYPIAQKASRYFLPSLALSAWKAHANCGELQLEHSGKIQCGHYEFSNPLHLFFYSGDFAKIESISDIQESENILIVNPIDASSEISSIDGKKITWGTLVATAISNLSQHDFPWRNAQIRFTELVIFLLFFLLIMCYSLFGRIRNCLTACIFSLIGVLILDLLFSVFTGARTYPIESFVALFAFSVVGLVLRASEDFEERRLIERALSGYVSEDRLKRLLAGKDRLQLEGRNREMTTLLLDIVGFSKISKELGHQRVFAFVQKFFQVVDPIIFKHGGTIDKKTGDGLLAFFGDYDGSDRPKEAARSAVRAALEIQKELKEIQDTKPHYFGIQQKLECRIGVNSGSLMIGNAGSERHFNYTVLGETVNFTQRLEAACPPGELLVGTGTRELLGEEFQIVDREIAVKNEHDLYKAGLVQI